MKSFFSIALIILFIGYSAIGTSGNVGQIKVKAIVDIPLRGWKIVRYDGFQYGSWGRHGGKVWYHVKDLKAEDVYYRVSISMWNGELQYHYGEPEKLSRVNVEY